MNARFARLLAPLLCVALSACGIERLAGGMLQNYEYQKLVETHAAYPGLEDRVVAVIVNVDMATQFEHPQVQLTVASNLARRIQDNVPGVSVIPPTYVAEWQFRTPQWEAMPYSELAEQLNVDRILHVDINEYRLHPYGNHYLWDGVCSANIGVIERDGLDPDAFAEVFAVGVAFPDMPGVTRETASARQIEAGVLSLFVRDTAWLFFTHLEPKYPEHFQGRIEEGRYDG